MTAINQAVERVQHLLVLGRLDAAMDAALKLQRDFPDQQGIALHLLGAVHLAFGRLDAAQECARRAIAELPEDPAPYRLMAGVLRRQGLTEEEIELLRTAIRLAPDQVGSRQDLAQALMDSDPEEAEVQAREALRLGPQDPDSHFILGETLQRSDPAGAERAFRAALQLDPEHQQAHFHLATLAITQGDWDAGTAGMGRLLGVIPTSALPVLFLDTKVWLAIRHGWLLTVVGLLLFWGLATVPAAGIGLAIGTATLGFATVSMYRGLRPIRASLPGRGRRYFRGFPGRNPTDIYALTLVVGAWFAMLYTSAIDLAEPTNAQTRGVGALLGFGLLVLVVALAWLRWAFIKRRFMGASHEPTRPRASRWVTLLGPSLVLVAIMALTISLSGMRAEQPVVVQPAGTSRTYTTPVPTAPISLPGPIVAPSVAWPSFDVPSVVVVPSVMPRET